MPDQKISSPSRWLNICPEIYSHKLWAKEPNNPIIKSDNRIFQLLNLRNKCIRTLLNDYPNQLTLQVLADLRRSDYLDVGCAIMIPQLGRRTSFRLGQATLNLIEQYLQHESLGRVQELWARDPRRAPLFVNGYGEELFDDRGTKEDPCLLPESFKQLREKTRSLLLSGEGLNFEISHRLSRAHVLIERDGTGRTRVCFGEPRHVLQKLYQFRIKDLDTNDILVKYVEALDQLTCKSEKKGSQSIPTAARPLFPSLKLTALINDPKMDEED